MRDPLLAHTGFSVLRRARVPRGAVGIADQRTGVYPAEGPGGWRLVGRVPTALFEDAAERIARFTPGGTVEFRPVGRNDYEQVRANTPHRLPLLPATPNVEALPGHPRFRQERPTPSHEQLIMSHRITLPALAALLALTLSPPPSTPSGAALERKPPKPPPTTPSSTRPPPAPSAPRS